MQASTKTEERELLWSVKFAETVLNEPDSQINYQREKLIINTIMLFGDMLFTIKSSVLLEKNT